MPNLVGIKYVLGIALDSKIVSIEIKPEVISFVDSVKGCFCFFIIPLQKLYIYSLFKKRVFQYL